MWLGSVLIVWLDSALLVLLTRHLQSQQINTCMLHKCRWNEWMFLSFIFIWHVKQINALVYCIGSLMLIWMIWFYAFIRSRISSHLICHTFILCWSIHYNLNSALTMTMGLSSQYNQPSLLTLLCLKELVTLKTLPRFLLNLSLDGINVNVAPWHGQNPSRYYITDDIMHTLSILHSLHHMDNANTDLQCLNINSDLNLYLYHRLNIITHILVVKLWTKDSFSLVNAK